MDPGSSALPGPSDTSRPSQVGRAKKTKTTKQKKSYVPRPMNAWMIYRKDKSASIISAPGYTKLSQSQMSQIISKQWKAETKAVKDHYEQLAAIEALNHKAMYPDYKYQPMSKEEKARQKELEKREKQIEKAALKKSKLPEPSPAPLPMLGHHVPYHLAAQHASLGPSPPYSTGSLPSSASTPSTSGEAYDSAANTSSSMSSSSTSYTSSPPTSDLPQFAMPTDDHSTPSTIVPPGSTSTSRVPSGASVVYHPSPSASTPVEPAMQYEWHLSEGPFTAPQPPEEGASDAFGADHASEDASQQPLYSEQFEFSDLLNPPQNEGLPVRDPSASSTNLSFDSHDATLQDVLALDLPILNMPGPWHEEAVQVSQALKEGWDQSVYTLPPNIDVENLEAANALQVDVVSSEELPFSLSPEDEADLTAYLQSIAGPEFNSDFSFENLGQDQQQQQTLAESLDMFQFTTLQDTPQQYMQYDNSQFYPQQMLESQFQQQQQVDPSLLMVSAPPMPQYAPDNASPVAPVAESTSSYTPPPGAARAGARRVAGSWRPPPQFMAPTPPVGTPQYLSPIPSGSWNVPTN